MPYGVWQATITDEKGNVVDSADVEVRLESDNSLATIYSDRQGNTQITQPGAKTDSEGFFRFYALGAGRSYKVTVTTSGGLSRTWRHQSTGLFSEHDPGDNISVGDFNIQGVMESDIDFNSTFRPINLPSPIEAHHPSTKGYVDGLFSGLDWQESVIDEQTTPPASPNDGDRYIVAPSGTDAWSGHDNEIAEWDGGSGSWTYHVPDSGTVTVRESDDRARIFNGTSWVMLGTFLRHASLPDLQGGASGERYHITSAQHTSVGNIVSAGHAEAMNQGVATVDSPTFAGITVNDTASNAQGKKTVSTNDPSGGANGDVWYKV